MKKHRAIPIKRVHFKKYDDDDVGTKQKHIDTFIKKPRKKAKKQ